MRIFHSFICCLLLFTACAPYKSVHDEQIDTSIRNSRFLQVTNKDSNEATIVCKPFSIDQAAGENKKLDKKAAKDLGLQTYLIEASGFRVGKKYTLYVVNAALDKVPMGNLIVNCNGELVFEADEFPLCNFRIALSGFMKGEQIYYVLVSDEDQSCLTVSLTPIPIEYTWNDGAYVCAILLTKDANIFMISGKGFQPNEPVIINSQTCNESIVHPSKAEADGTFHALLFPAVIGVEGALGTYTIKREHCDEVGALNYLWGTAAKPEN